MKKQRIQDERILMQKRKINSEAFSILWIALLVSVIIQQFFLDAPVEQYVVELICYIGMSFYMIVRHIMLGLNLYGEEKRAKIIPLVNSIVAGITTTAINCALNYTQYAEQYKEDGIGYFIAVLAIFFISVTISVFIVLSFFGYLNKKRQMQIEKNLNEEDIIDE